MSTYNYLKVQESVIRNTLNSYRVLPDGTWDDGMLCRLRQHVTVSANDYRQALSVNDSSVHARRSQFYLARRALDSMLKYLEITVA